MKFNKLLLVPLVTALFVSANVSASSTSIADEDREARNCLATSGSGSSYTYAYKNPGWNGKACNKALHVFACKGSTCQSTKKGSDTSGVLRHNGQWKPGFTPKSSVVIYNQ